VGREKLDAFLKNHFHKHAFQTITTEQFLEEYKNDLIAGDAEAATKIDIEKWIYGPGIPSNVTKIISKKFIFVDEQVAAYKNGTPANKLETKNFTTSEWLRFLRALPDEMSDVQMNELDSAFHFSSSGNSEILFAWLEHVIASKYKPSYPALENFLMKVGRRKFVKPLFAALLKTPEGIVMAKNIYAKSRANYHPITQGSIDEMMKGK
jgi:hypothetical protein